MIKVKFGTKYDENISKILSDNIIMLPDTKLEPIAKGLHPEIVTATTKNTIKVCDTFVDIVVADETSNVYNAVLTSKKAVKIKYEHSVKFDGIITSCDKFNVDTLLQIKVLSIKVKGEDMTNIKNAIIVRGAKEVEEDKQQNIEFDITADTDGLCTGLVFKCYRNSGATTKDLKFYDSFAFRYVERNSCSCSECKDNLKQFVVNCLEHNFPEYDKNTAHVGHFYRLDFDGNAMRFTHML